MKKKAMAMVLSGSSCRIRNGRMRKFELVVNNSSGR